MWVDGKVEDYLEVDSEVDSNTFEVDSNIFEVVYSQTGRISVLALPSNLTSPPPGLNWKSYNY